MSIDRLPPQSVENEQAVLGSLLIDTDAIVEVADVLQPQDFYRNHHGTIYAAVVDLYARRVPADIVTVSEALEADGKLEQIGGSGYLTSLVNLTPTSRNVAFYAGVVREKALLRELIGVAGRIAAIGYEDTTAAQAVDRAGQLLFALQRRDPRRWLALQPLLAQTYDEIERMSSNRGQPSGVATGLADLDVILGGGFQRSDLVILAARPSVGKTSMALQFTEHAARQGRTVGVFSAEMSRGQLAQRLIAAQARLDVSLLRSGHLSGEDFMRVADAIQSMQRHGIYIDDSPTLTPLELRTKARRLHAEHGLDLVVIDYLQLMHAPSSGDRNRVQEVSEISRQLKALARELDVPVVALSQLSRVIEQRGGRPRLSDLRDSGSIEQDADVVAFLWHPPAKDQEYPADDSVAEVEVIVAKQRNGPTAACRLIFQKGYTRFEQRSTMVPAWAATR